MSDEGNIPTLTDLIESGDRIDISDLGLDDELKAGNDPRIDDTIIDISDAELEADDPFEDNPALEQSIRLILDKHMEQAWQEIRLLLGRELNK